MIALIQRVTHSAVVVAGETIGAIDEGLMVLVGVQREDESADAHKLAERVANYRVFADKFEKMNLSVLDVKGAVLAIPQFTLAADTSRGRRPSFGHAAPPHLGKTRFDEFCRHLTTIGVTLETGEFGADMQVELTNNGPVTFWLTS